MPCLFQQKVSVLKFSFKNIGRSNFLTKVFTCLVFQIFKRYLVQEQLKVRHICPRLYYRCIPDVFIPLSPKILLCDMKFKNDLKVNLSWNSLNEFFNDENILGSDRNVVLEFDTKECRYVMESFKIHQTKKVFHDTLWKISSWK